MSVARSASGAGVRPAASIFASTKRSISLRGQSARLTGGAAGRTGGVNAQCGSYGAPSAIQRSRSFFWVSESRRLESGGGISTSGSVE